MIYFHRSSARSPTEDPCDMRNVRAIRILDLGNGLSKRRTCTRIDFNNHSSKEGETFYSEGGVIYHVAENGETTSVCHFYDDHFTFEPKLGLTLYRLVFVLERLYCGR